MKTIYPLHPTEPNTERLPTNKLNRPWMISASANTLTAKSTRCEMTYDVRNSGATPRRSKFSIVKPLACDTMVMIKLPPKSKYPAVGSDLHITCHEQMCLNQCFFFAEGAKPQNRAFSKNQTQNSNPKFEHLSQPQGKVLEGGWEVVGTPGGLWLALGWET